MKVRRKLLIIDKHQFGSLTDTYKWCQYLAGKYDVTIVCFKASVNQFFSGIRLLECPLLKSRILRGLYFVFRAIWRILWHRGPILVVYFPGCTVFKRVFRHRKMLLDIRTLSIAKSDDVRKMQNRRLQDACMHYDGLSVISQGVADAIGIKDKSVDVLPLGSDVISVKQKSYVSKLSLLYVGTFDGRNMHQVIEGIALFHSRNPNVDFSFDVVGDGHGTELYDLRNLVRKYELDEYVKLHGRIPITQLQPFFDACNVGVSYVPITEYYDNQPPTKTFEYVLSGLYTIATATLANKQIINHDNGLLILDTPDSFAQSLETVLLCRETFDEKKIRASLQDYTWDKIVANILVPILNKFE